MRAMQLYCFDAATTVDHLRQGSGVQVVSTCSSRATCEAVDQSQKHKVSVPALCALRWTVQSVCMVAHLL